MITTASLGTLLLPATYLVPPTISETVLTNQTESEELGKLLQTAVISAAIKTSKSSGKWVCKVEFQDLGLEQMNITSECKSLWGEPERVHRISAVNIENECTV